MKDLLPPWGWAIFAVLFAATGALYLALGKSIVDDTCTTQRQYCKTQNHAFE